MPKDFWHVESDEHCEYMRCGLRISVEENVRIRNTWGQRRCPDCWLSLEEEARVLALSR